MAMDGSLTQLVQAGRVPRYIYRHGGEGGGARTILAGASFLSAEQALQLEELAASQLASPEASSGGAAPLVDAARRFELRPVDPSWVELLVPEARRGQFVQVVPLDDVTIDVPDMSVPFDAAAAGPWRWLADDWTYDAPVLSKVAANLAALRGETVTEVSRWETDYFEAFAGSGPDTPRDEVRFVAVSTLVGYDMSLASVADLPVGTSVWRASAQDDWHAWG